MSAVCYYGSKLDTPNKSDEFYDGGGKPRSGPQSPVDLSKYVDSVYDQGALYTPALLMLCVLLIHSSKQ